MPNSRSLALIAPHVGMALAQAIAERSARWPQLARFAGRGVIGEAPAARAGLSHWQIALLEALGIADSPASYPAGAVSCTGATQRTAEGYWLLARPMHFAAGMAHLDARLLQGASRLSAAERAQLEPTIGAHLRSCGLELTRAANDDWLIRSERALAIEAVPPEVAARGPLDELMPKGQDAASLRRWMTEVQMLLHEHPVNVERRQRSLLEVNALWFYGGGEVGRVQAQRLPQGFGDDLYLSGIYRLHGLDVTSAPPDARGLLQARPKGGAVAVVLTDDLDALEALWLAPLARALAAGAIAQLDLILGAWRILVRRGALLRFWRRQLEPAQWHTC